MRKIRYEKLARYPRNLQGTKATFSVFYKIPYPLPLAYKGLNFTT